MNNPEWSYDEAFSRNLGLVSPEEQQILGRSHVAIMGMGGVGGIHLVTLARLGIGKFTIADFDVFEPANTNRQYGATVSAMGKSKVEVMAAVARDINPEIEVRTIPVALTPENADAFLDDADLLVDGMDVFELDIRRVIFRKAAERGIFAVSAGPVGFGAAWLSFDPKGMSFDRYFGFTDDMDPIQKFAAFIAATSPKPWIQRYIDRSYVDISNRKTPSTGLACQLCAGVLAAETLKILLKRGGVKSVPNYHQFDPYLNVFKKGRILGGGSNPLQRIKRWLLEKYLHR